MKRDDIIIYIITFGIAITISMLLLYTWLKGQQALPGILP